MKKLNTSEESIQLILKDKSTIGPNKKLVEDVHKIIMLEMANIQTFNLAYKNFDNIDLDSIYNTYVQLKSSITHVKERHDLLEKSYFENMVDIQKSCTQYDQKTQKIDYNKLDNSISEPQENQYNSRFQTSPIKQMLSTDKNSTAKNYYTKGGLNINYPIV